MLPAFCAPSPARGWLQTCRVSVSPRPQGLGVKAFKACGVHRAGAPCMSVSPTEDTTVEPIAEVIPIRAERIGLAALYAGYAIFALFFTPGGWLSTESHELSKIMHLDLAHANAVFFSIFNLFGAVVASYAMVLNAGATRQKRIPYSATIIAGFLVGIGGLGPYLISREYVPSIDADEVHNRGFISKLHENRWYGVAILVYALLSYAFGFGVFTPEVPLQQSVADFWKLIGTDRFVCSTTVDYFVMCVALLGPMQEDMRRRGWFDPEEKARSTFVALAFLFLPAVGPALYTIFRPPLPRKVV